MPSLLPNAKTQFIDGNGSPLAGGSVTHYLPGTTTPATTWQDSAGTIPNLNPLTLDAYGMAVIWGSGSYRQVVKNAAGVTIWDQNTSAIGGTNKFPDTNIAGTQSINTVPTANPQVTVLSSLNVQATTAVESGLEYMVSFGLTSSKGATAPGYMGDKVTLYAGIDVMPGSGDAWSLNTVAYMHPNSGTSNVQGYELDFVNQNADRGNAPAGGGFNAPIAIPLSIAGSSTHLSTTAIEVAGPGAAIWNRGISFVNTSVAQATFQDLTTSTTSIDIWEQHAYGVDTLNASFTGLAFRLSQGGQIGARNSAGSGDVALLSLAGTNLFLGSASVTGTTTFGNGQPATDNTYSWGASGTRYSSIWAVNGTIQTSDPSLKTDINPLPSVLGLVADINPVTFRWKSGGFDLVEQTVRKQVHATEAHTWDQETVEMQDGKAVLVKTPVTHEKLIYDTVPVIGADGKQVVDDIPAKPAIVDKAGNIVQPAMPAQSIPRTHRVPRMVEQDVIEKVPVERPGKRMHWGFLAPDVQAAFAKLGMDFAGHVIGEDGTHALRPDQMVPVLWKAVQELAAEVAALKAKASP